FLNAPSLSIASRWHGVYVKHPSVPFLIARPAPDITVITGLGGAGVTLSFGVAGAVVASELGEQPLWSEDPLMGLTYAHRARRLGHGWHHRARRRHGQPMCQVVAVGRRSYGHARSGQCGHGHS